MNSHIIEIILISWNQRQRKQIKKIMSLQSCFVAPFPLLYITLIRLGNVTHEMTCWLLPQSSSIATPYTEWLPRLNVPAPNQRHQCPIKPRTSSLFADIHHSWYSTAKMHQWESCLIDSNKQQGAGCWQTLQGQNYSMLHVYSLVFKGAQTEIALKGLGVLGSISSWIWC